MADDPKEPHSRPPLADKGDARPLTRNEPGDGKPADPRHGQRPSGLHTRPDLYGARAVIRRPVGESSEGGEEAGQPQGHGDEAGPPDAAPRRDAAGMTTESDDERSAAEGGPALPAANLLDHPPRIPESITFEDWTGGPKSEPEEGARAPAAASTVGDEPDLSRPEPRRAPLGHSPRAAADDTVDPGRTSEPPMDDAGLAARLVARLGREMNLRRLREDRWPLAVAAVSCAALLLAVLAGGIVGLTWEDQKPLQQAQGPDAAAQDIAEQAETDSQDLPVAPAGSNFGIDEPSRMGPNRSGATIADRTGGSQLATLPDPGQSGVPDPNRDPIVDFMRIDPDGKAVVAGRAAPGTELTVLDNGEPLGSITADIYGLWTFVSQDPLASGRHEIGLKVRRTGSEVSDPVLVTEGGSSPAGETVAAAETEEAPAAADLSRQDSSTADQMAAAEPEPPVQSDETASPEPAGSPDASAADTAETAATVSAKTEPALPAEPEAGHADQADQAGGSAKPQTAGASEPAQTPAAKPEPSAKIQTAAVPAGGDYVVQLASFKNPDTAVREQTLVEEQFSDLLAGHDIFVQQVDLAEQGTYYRLRLGPFASLADARASCTRFQERDHDCIALAR